MSARYGIAEWYGRSLTGLSRTERQHLAEIALTNGPAPPCPFQKNLRPCRKRGGVCSLQRYRKSADGQLGLPEGAPVIVCPSRFEEQQLLVVWLAEIVGFSRKDAMLAREIPFMHGTETGKAAGKIDMVVASSASKDELKWYGLEIQAVYFSGPGMTSEFENQRDCARALPPFPDAIRRPDWRSSSAKRLMPQLQIKVPTLRRWGSKLAVAVDGPFFDSLGGVASDYSRDLNDGDVIWLIPELKRQTDGRYQLSAGHWEALTLEASTNKLLAAETVRRDTFEQNLKTKLELF